MSKIIIKEYLGNSIQFKMIEGHIYANATSMCKALNKRAQHWLELEATKEMVNEISNEAGIPASELIIIKKGGNPKEQGTWIYEELVLELAGWLDVKFRRWCQKQIATLLREGEVEIKTERIGKFNLLMGIITASTDIERALAMNQYENNYVKPLEIENKKQKDYIDHVVINEKYYIIPKQIGAKFNMTANLLNKVLNGLGIIYRVGKKWCLTRDYLGIADYNYFQKPNGEWEKGTSLHYSNEGEKLIFDILVANGYEPVQAK